MSKSYLLSADYLRELASLVRWWRAHRGDLDLPQRDKRALVPHQISRFELIEDVTPGGTAQAYRLVWIDGEWTHADPPQEETVRDLLSICRGKARDEDASPVLDGTIVEAYKMHDRTGWAIVNCKPWPLMIHGRLTDDLTGTDSTFKIDGVSIMQPVGAIDVEHILDSSDEVTIQNTFGWSGDENGECIAVWDESEDHWKAIQVECPA